MPRLPLLSKYCSVLRPFALASAKRVHHADAVDRILREAVDDLRRRDAENLVDRRHDVVDVVELRPRCLVGLDARRPRDRERIARAAEVRRDQLRVAQRRVARPRPAGVVHVVHLRAAECVEPAELVHHLDLLFDGVRNLILREQFADAAVLAFGARAVVAPDVDDQRVVADAEPVEFVDHAARLHVDVLDETREHFHQAPLKRPLRFRNAVPRRHRIGARRELRILGNPAEFLLPLERAFAQRIPAVVELAFILVGPLFEDVVRTVTGAGRPVHQERLIRRVRAMLAHPEIALSARSSLKWYFGSCGGSTALKFSNSRGSHCDVSPARNP